MFCNNLENGIIRYQWSKSEESVIIIEIQRCGVKLNYIINYYL